MHNQGVFKVRRLNPAMLLAMALFFLLAAMTQADTDRSHGLLWEISKAGQVPSHLFGTIHSEEPGVVALPAPVKQAFDASNIVVVEMLMDTEAMMYSSTAMLMLDGRSLSDVLGVPLYKQVSEAIASRGIPELVLNRMKPWAAAVTLSTPALETGQVLDLVLYQEALQQEKAVHGLETIQEQLDLFDSMPESDQVTLLRDAVDNLPELDAMNAELLAAYKQRDLAGLPSMKCRCRLAINVWHRTSSSVSSKTGITAWRSVCSRTCDRAGPLLQWVRYICRVKKVC